ncbi:NACHT domain-containing protein [Saccharothrix xinjiangensis]|uniref:NACHT domain-containing protein n=1 Tax=Saccharothrix xinjiangensis TaxID=204798 RepID=A0ABV9XUI9_9PSEU
MAWRPSPSTTLVVGIAIALVGNMATNTVSVNRPWWPVTVWVAVAALVVAAVLLEKRRAPGALGQEEDLPALVDHLATVVRKQWRDEVARRSLNDPYPLPVRWDPAPADLVASWADITRLAVDGVGRPRGEDRTAWAPSADELVGDDLIEIWRRVPTGRLVVLGAPGTGKTMLLARFVVDVLDPTARVKGTPVPVLVSAASWNPNDQDLPTWLAERLAVDHPALDRRTAGGTSLLRRLLDEGLVLVVLDGLDEIPERLRSRAVAEMNAWLAGGARLVVSSRTDAYREATRPPGGAEVTLTGAAGIRLRPLDTADVVSYLRSSAGGPAGERRWDRVAAALAGSGPLATTMVTPLMATLARIVHNPPPGVDPGSVPSPDVLVGLPDREAIEQHLFDGFVPAAYRRHPGGPTRWRADHAHEWLEHLAHHLEHHRAASPDLAWWQLHLRPAPRAPSPVVGLAAAGSLSAVAGIASGFLYGSAYSHTTIVTLSFFLVPGLTVCVTTSLVFGVVRWLTGQFGAAISASAVTGIAGGLAIGVIGDVTDLMSPMPLLLISIGLATGFAHPDRRGELSAVSAGMWFGAVALVAYTALYSLRTDLPDALHEASAVAVRAGLLLLAGITLDTARNGQRPRWSALLAFAVVMGAVRGFTMWLSRDERYGAIVTDDHVVIAVLAGSTNLVLTGAIALIAILVARGIGDDRPHPWGALPLATTMVVFAQALRYGLPNGVAVALLGLVVCLSARRAVRAPRARAVLAVGRGVSVVVLGVVTAGIYGFEAAVVEALAAIAFILAFRLAARAREPRDWLTSPLLAGLSYGFVHVLFDSPEYGLAVGVVVGLVVELAASHLPARAPAQELRLAKRGLLPGALVAAVVSAVLLWRYGPVTACVIGATVGCAVGLAYGVEVPRRVTAVRTPARVLARDRGVFLVVFAATVLTIAVTTGFVAGSGEEFNTGAGLVGGLSYGVATGVLIATGRAQWLHYLVTRCALALTGRAPWRLMAFLEDAHTVHGVLRQNGATYQFRHLEVQRRLAATYAATSARRGTAGTPAATPRGSARPSPRPTR